MSIHGHNGGPPLIEDDGEDVRMRFARIHISDFLNGIRKMPLEARGFYVTGLFCMYDNMGSLPADDRMAALQMNCNIRTYQRLRAMMLDMNAFGDSRTRWIDTGEGLSQKRVQDEIGEYCREFRNRRDAALRREADKRAREDAAAITPIEANAGQSIGPIIAEKAADVSPIPHSVADAFPSSEATKSQLRPVLNSSKIDLNPVSNSIQKPELSEKTNEINEATTTAVPQQAPQPTPQDGGHPKPKPKPIEEREEKKEDIPKREYVPLAVSVDQTPKFQTLCVPPPLPVVVQPPIDDEPVRMVDADLDFGDGNAVAVIGEPDRPTPGRRRATPSDAFTAFEKFNDLAMRIGLPQARTLTPGRRKGIIARLNEHGLDAWDLALANVERSAFLRGKNNRNWRADIDFLLQATRFAKVVDGVYGNGAHGDTIEPDETQTQRIMRKRAEQLARRHGTVPPEPEQLT